MVLNSSSLNLVSALHTPTPREPLHSLPSLDLVSFVSLSYSVTIAWFYSNIKMPPSLIFKVQPDASWTRPSCLSVPSSLPSYHLT